MAGIAQWSKNVEVSANPFSNVENVLETTSEIVAVGGVLETLIYAPTGYIAELLNIVLSFPAPVSATSGTHTLFLRVGGAGLLDIISATATFDKALEFTNGEWSSLLTDVHPSDVASQTIQSRGQFYDSSQYLRITYVNQTDAVNSGEKVMRLWVKNSKVG